MSVAAASNPVFYRVGGTIPLDVPSYVVRKADEDLFSALLSGDYCYVLDSRQIGKSSLMLRTAVHLRKEGVAALILDLTALGQNVTPEQWYFGLLGQIARGMLQFDLDLEDEFDAHWEEHPELGPLQRWTAAIENIVLKRWNGKVALFIDEIDCVRSLRFSTDEFFAGIRELYNRRSYKPDLHRLAFCLLGVASPSDLVKDPHTTPFNIGRRIELTDFTEQEAAPLAAGLGRDELVARKLLARILYWTAGHPYLSQVLCRAIAEDPKVADAQGVDRHCEELFLSARAREKDDNLLFVSRQMLACQDLPAVLTLYDKIRRGRRPVADDETDFLINHLRLAGIVRARQGILQVRNRIYRQVFDDKWVISRMPDAELRRQREAYKRGMIKAGAIAASLILLILAGNVAYLYLFVWEHVTYAKGWNKRHGSFEPDGVLTREEVRHRSVSYRFVRYGRLNQIVLMQSVNSEGRLSTEHGLGTYFGESGKSQGDDEICQWQTVYDRDGRVVYERALNREGQMIWGFVYSPSAVPDKTETGGFLNSLLKFIYPAFANPGRRLSEAKGHYVGPDGYPKPNATTGAEYVQFFYDKNGFEGLILYKDRLGNPKQGLDKAFGKFNLWNSEGRGLCQISLDATGKPMIDEGGNCGALTYFDTDGDVTFSVSFDTEGNLVDWKDKGIAARAYSRDQYGNSASLSYYNADGSPGLNEDGFHRVDKIFDDRGHVVEYRYFGRNDEPVSMKEGHHIWRGSYDKAGNLIDFAYFDKEARPTTIASGYHKAVSSYDERGRQTTIAYFDTAGNKTLHKDGYHIATTEFEGTSDRKGQTMNRWRYYDIDGKPVENSSLATHMSLSTFDANGRATEYAYFGRDGQPATSRYGYQRIRQGFDVAGNRIERSYFGIDGKPALSLDGFSSDLAAYNENGKQISIAYFGKDGQPTIVKDTGLHRVVRSFDLLGRPTEETFFGPDGRPILNGFRVHSKRSHYDSQDNEIQTDYFGISEERINCVDGYHRRKSAYDKWNRLVDQRYFDTNGRPCADSSTGAHRVSYRYDPRGWRTEISYFDENDRPTLSGQQFHSRKNEYDDRGNQIGTRLFGINGEPVAPAGLGYHYLKSTFDEKSRKLSESYFDTQDQATHLPQTSVHRVAYTNNNLGRPVETEYFQEDGSPGARRDGVHKIVQEFDAAARTLKEHYFGLVPNSASGPPPVLSFTLRRDEQGNIVERTLSNANGEPITLPPDRRVHRATFRYDGSGHAIEEDYFDAQGKPALGQNGSHRTARVFDGNGNIIEVLTFDEQGKPASIFGKHRTVSVFDGRDVVRESYFDSQGLPVARNGISGRRSEGGKLVDLDESGNPTSVIRVLTVSAPPFKGGRGDAAGLRTGDIILAYDNWRFPIEAATVDWNVAYDGLIAALQAPGDAPRKLVVLRDGQLVELSPAPGILQVRLTGEACSGDWLRNAARELIQR